MDTAAFQKRPRDLRRDANACGGVLSITDNEVYRVRRSESRYRFQDSYPSRFTDDITDHQHTHRSPDFLF
jgi:hypothetical protein